MFASDYADFDLEIIRIARGRYQARVIESPAGQASAEFRRPFSDLELENFVLKIGRTRTGTRRLNSPEMQAAESFGKKLFDTVFREGVRECLTSSLHQVDRNEIPGLRLRLRLVGVPELANLPWEYLYHATLRRFIVLSAQTPITRYTDLPRPVTPLSIAAPLRLLVMIAGPSDYPPLDVDQEKAKLEAALRHLEQHGLIKLEWLEKATLSALQQRLRKEPVHLFHFVGHGGWDEQAHDGVLLFEDEQRRGRQVSANHLGTILRDHKSLRLVVLNACEGARTSPTDPFAGVASTLVQQGIPAVVAMQFEITDRAAIELAHVFYGSLADGYPAEAALAEARKAIFASGNDVEWGTPVLYLRAPDGRLFDMSIQPLLEAKHIAQQKTEKERLTREQAEQERLAQERAKAERLAAQKAEAEHIAREKAGQQRLAQQKAEAYRLAKQKAREEQVAQKKAERERRTRERTQAIAAVTHRLRTIFTRNRILSGLVGLGALVGLFVIVNGVLNGNDVLSVSATQTAEAIAKLPNTPRPTATSRRTPTYTTTPRPTLTATATATRPRPTATLTATRPRPTATLAPAQPTINVNSSTPEPSISPNETYVYQVSLVQEPGPFNYDTYGSVTISLCYPNPQLNFRFFFYVRNLDPSDYDLMGVSVEVDGVAYPDKFRQESPGYDQSQNYWVLWHIEGRPFDMLSQRGAYTLRIAARDKTGVWHVFPGESINFSVETCQ